MRLEKWAAVDSNMLVMDLHTDAVLRAHHCLCYVSIDRSLSLLRALRLGIALIVRNLVG
jgi:hypothetical protein